MYEMDLGKTDLLKHQIELKQPTVIHKRYSSTQLDSIDQEVEKLLKAGIITLSTSPHSSPILLVPKLSGKWRCCFDGCYLSDATLDQYFPIATHQKCLCRCLFLLYTICNQWIRPDRTRGGQQALNGLLHSARTLGI